MATSRYCFVFGYGKDSMSQFARIKSQKAT